MRNHVFIHAGYPKAGSTTLQKHLFNKHSELLNLGLYPLHNIGNDSEDSIISAAYLDDEELRTLYSSLTDLDVIEYEHSGNGALFNRLAERYLDTNNRVAVLSNEKLTSVFFAHRDNGAKAERVHDLLPGAKIILVIRNQYNWLKSQYRDHPFDPRDFVIGRPVSFDAWFKIAFWNKYMKLFPALNYHNVIDFYVKLFGRENVGIFLFEELAREPASFARQISNFMCINTMETERLLADKHENTSVSHRYNIYRACKRKYLSRPPGSWLYSQWLETKFEPLLKTGAAADYSLSFENLSRLKKYFGPGNRALVEKYGLNLEKYDYFL